MTTNMENRRAAYAVVRVRDIDNEGDAQTKRVHAARAIALIRNAGLIKAMAFIRTNLPDIYDDLLGWLKKSRDKDGPQLSAEVRQSASQDGIVAHIAEMESHLQYMRMGKEIIAILEHIKLMAEGQKNHLASVSETLIGDAHA